MKKPINQRRQFLLLAITVVVITLVSSAVLALDNQQIKSPYFLTVNNYLADTKIAFFVNDDRIIGRWRWTSDIFKDGKVVDMSAGKTSNQFSDDGSFTEVIAEGEEHQIIQKGRYGVQGERLTTVIEANGKSYSSVYTMHIDDDGKTLTLIDALGTHIFKRM